MELTSKQLKALQILKKMIIFSKRSEKARIDVPYPEDYDEQSLLPSEEQLILRISKASEKELDFYLEIDI